MLLRSSMRLRHIFAMCKVEGRLDREESQAILCELLDVDEEELTIEDKRITVFLNLDEDARLKMLLNAATEKRIAQVYKDMCAFVQEQSIIDAANDAEERMQDASPDNDNGKQTPFSAVGGSTDALARHIQNLEAQLAREERENQVWKL